MNPAVARKALGELSKGVGQTGAFERLWPQAQEHSARVFQTAFGELPGASQAVGGNLSFVQTHGRLKVQQNPRELLRQGIMDLARQSAALFHECGRGKSFHHATQVNPRGDVRAGVIAAFRRQEPLMARSRIKTRERAIEILQAPIPDTVPRRGRTLLFVANFHGETVWGRLVFVNSLTGLRRYSPFELMGFAVVSGRPSLVAAQG